MKISELVAGGGKMTQTKNVGFICTATIKFILQRATILINAHGGKLVNRVTDDDPSGLFSVDISPDLANDVENIADGIFSPLEGFLNQEDFESVVSNGRLANGIAWTMPTVLDVDDDTGKKIKEAGDVLLKNPEGTGIAILHVEDCLLYTSPRPRD